MRGRKPKPVEQRRREGNPGHRPLPETVLVGGRGVPKKPAGLPTEAKKAWDDLAPLLHKANMLDKADLFAFECLVLQVARMKEATAHINEHGITIEGSMGQQVENPMIRAERAAQSEVRKWCERFGLDPSSRTRMGLAEQSRKPPEKELEDQIGKPKLRAVG